MILVQKNICNNCGSCFTRYDTAASRRKWSMYFFCDSCTNVLVKNFDLCCPECGSLDTDSRDVRNGIFDDFQICFSCGFCDHVRLFMRMNSEDVFANITFNKE